MVPTSNRKYVCINMRITFKWEREEIIFLIFRLFFERKRKAQVLVKWIRETYDTDTVGLLNEVMIDA